MSLSKMLVLAVPLMLAATPPGAAGPNHGLGALQECLAASAKAGRLSGIVAVGRGGALAASDAFGHPDPAGRLSFSPRTPFNIASAGKMFTAVAIGQLVEKRKLSFDQPIGHVMAGLPASIGKITIDQLLTHRSGLGDYLRPENAEAIRAARTASDLLPLAIRDGFAFAPGSKQQYSNSGYVVLGAVIEKLSGMSYADYVRTHIFVPAGMSAADLAGTAPRATAMTKHQPDGSMASVARPAPEIGGRRGGPAGGAVASALDMVKFGEALRSGKLLSRSIVEQLWAARVPGQSRDGAQVSYAYGFVRMDYPDGRWAVGHGGGSLGINAEFDLFPASGETIVALSNYDPPSATDAMAMARRAILGQPPC
ncbi:MAG TPA: serine hydrolase domain-containing protein [Sphingomicrobium sp.]|nr:serine hydrolase domain-containing protein [Sphingomicrobium sp.]